MRTCDTKEQEVARRRVERKRMVRERLAKLGVKAMTSVGKDGFEISTSELMKLLKLREPVTIDAK